MSVQSVPLSDVRPNPYRRIERYSIDEEKVEALMQSYENSGFWDGSIQGRPSTLEPGKVEIAFGHHRVEAARRKSLPAIGIVVSERSNTDMLRMMADENRSEFKHDARVGVETIAAVVEAYGRGEVELEAVAADGPRAGNVILPGGKIYNLATVARFLGWVKPSDGQATNACRQAFDAYQSRATTERALLSLTPGEASSIAVESVTVASRAARASAEKAGLPPSKVRQAEKRAAETAVREIKDSSGYRASQVAVGIGKAAVQAVLEKKPKSAPPVEVYIDKIIARCAVAEPYHQILTDCERLIPYIDDIDKARASRLASALEAMLKRTVYGVSSVCQALRSGNRQRLRKALEAGSK